jgi:hypothetical protein
MKRHLVVHLRRKRLWVACFAGVEAIKRALHGGSVLFPSQFCALLVTRCQCPEKGGSCIASSVSELVGSFVLTHCPPLADRKRARSHAMSCRKRQRLHRDETRPYVFPQSSACGLITRRRWLGLISVRGASHEEPSDRGCMVPLLKKVLPAVAASFAFVCTSAQAQDLALNQPSTASSTQGGLTQYRPANANDGNSNTRWSSDPANREWWEVDLGAVRSINRVELNWEAAYARRYRIWTRTSPSDSWSTAATVSIASPGLKIHSFPARDARFVRIRGDQRATQGGISLWDARVFGPTSSLPPPLANFSVSPAPAIRNRPTTFTSTGSCPDVPCAYKWFHWDATNGPSGEIETGATQPNTEAEFTYTGPAGTRGVMLRVTDAHGNMSETPKTFQLVDPQAALVACNDGVDNDGDRKVDYPSDPGCSGATDTSETDPPPSTGFPDASNTGVPAGITLSPSGGMTISTAGTVVDARDISGPVVVNAPNVTIRNSRIRATSYWAIDNNSTGLLIQDSEIDGLRLSNTCIGSSNLIVRRVNIHGCENGFNVNPGNMTVEDSYIHDLTTGNGAHTDGAQFGRGAHDITFRHNTIDPVSPGGGTATSCIIMWDDVDPQNTRVWIENNRLLGAGAAWTMYGPRLPATDIHVTNNRWERGVFGYYNGITSIEFVGNVDDIFGKPI